MPRSAGTYSLPANAHAVSGNTISSTYFNNLIDDLANEMTNSVARDGSSAMTGTLNALAGVAGATFYTFDGGATTGFYSSDPTVINVKISGTTVGTFDATGWVGNTTGVFNGKAYADVASATTTDIGAATSNFVNITGTTTITGLGTAAAGTLRWIKFAGILTFTYNATSLILPGAASITTAAGDTCVAVSAGGGNWRVLNYNKASGVATVVSNTGKIGQVVTTVTAAVATGTTTMPYDDTIPQIAEGDQYLSRAITPSSASSTLIIDVVLTGTHSATGDLVAALFQDATANALVATANRIGATAAPSTLVMRHVMTAGTTSSTTFTVRAGGGNSAGTFTLNGSGGARLLGGVLASSITIREILP